MCSLKSLQGWSLAVAVLIGACSGAEARYSQSTIQQTVNEVSRPDNGAAATRPVRVRKRTAHWKTKYWNQKSTNKVKTHN